MDNTITCMAYGDCGVGKSTLFRCLAKKIFSYGYVRTDPVDRWMWTFRHRYTFQVYECGGHRHALHQEIAHEQTVHAAILCFNAKKFDAHNIKQEYEFLSQSYDTVHVVALRTEKPIEIPSMEIRIISVHARTGHGFDLLQNSICDAFEAQKQQHSLHCMIM